MAVFSIIARIACDGCGTLFNADLDSGYKPPQGWSLFDCAEDAVRGGADGGSVQGKHMLCNDCTRFIDQHTDDAPTCEQVRAALDKMPPRKRSRA
jgi:RNA polymerase subunit RPABC4/transcription elongation factor Spt4